MAKVIVGRPRRRELQECYGGSTYAVKKWQLNKKEIRRLPKLR